MMEQTIEKLVTMKLFGMVNAYEEQKKQPDMKGLSFEERFSLIVDQESLFKDNKRLSRLLKMAEFRIKDACLENINYKAGRSLEKKEVMELSRCQWIKDNLNVLITGPASAGKSHLACALGNKACREGFSVKYYRVPFLFEFLTQSRIDGSHLKVLDRISHFDLLILDDFGLSPLSPDERKDFLEIVEDRYDCRSTIITSQYPVEHWHELIGDPSVADAILERIVHNSYKFRFKEGANSIRKEKADLKLIKGKES